MRLHLRKLQKDLGSDIPRYISHAARSERADRQNKTKNYTMRLPKYKLPRGTSHLKFKKHKKSVNHLQNDEVTALKEDMRAKKEAKEADEEEKKQLMDEEKVEVELTKQEKHEAKLERKKARLHRSNWKKHTGMGYNTNKNGPRAI